jgi:hypothetical protein
MLGPATLRHVLSIHQRNRGTSDTRVGFAFAPSAWAGEPVNAEPHKHSELIWVQAAAGSTRPWASRGELRVAAVIACQLWSIWSRDPVSIRKLIAATTIAASMPITLAAAAACVSPVQPDLRQPGQHLRRLDPGQRVVHGQRHR